MEAAVRITVHSEFPRDKVVHVNVDDVLACLNGDMPQGTVDQLYDFGKLMLDQIRALRNSYDAKLTSCLGWSTVTSAVLLSRITTWVGPSASGKLASVATVLVGLSVIASMFGLKSWSGWKWPSEKDWFHEELFPWPDRLRRQHLVSMLEAHQSYSRKTQKKGYALMLSEYSLIGSAVFLTAAIIVKQVA